MAEDGMYRPGGWLYLLTLTAPGSAEHYLPSGKRCRCTPVGGVDLAEWNPRAGRLWNQFLIGVERHYSVRPRYFRAAETQERGALHHHVIVWSPRKLSVRVLRPLAIAAGYGHALDLAPIERGSRSVARYITKRVAGYVTKSADARDDVPWVAEYVDHETGEVLRGQTTPTFRTWSSSRDWGVTMRELVATEQEDFRRHIASVSLSQPVVDGAPAAASGPGADPPAPS